MRIFVEGSLLFVDVFFCESGCCATSFFLGAKRGKCRV